MARRYVSGTMHNMLTSVSLSRRSWLRLTRTISCILVFSPLTFSFFLFLHSHFVSSYIRVFSLFLHFHLFNLLVSIFWISQASSSIVHWSLWLFQSSAAFSCIYWCEQYRSLHVQSSAVSVSFEFRPTTTRRVTLKRAELTFILIPRKFN